jgi:hypothetical protein
VPSPFTPRPPPSAVYRALRAVRSPVSPHPSVQSPPPGTAAAAGDSASSPVFSRAAWASRGRAARHSVVTGLVDASGQLGAGWGRCGGASCCRPGHVAWTGRHTERRSRCGMQDRVPPLRSGRCCGWFVRVWSRETYRHSMNCWQSTPRTGRGSRQAGSSVVSALFCFGFAQHYSHIAKTAEHTERIHRLLAEQAGL